MNRAQRVEIAIITEPVVTAGKPTGAHFRVRPTLGFRHAGMSRSTHRTHGSALYAENLATPCAVMAGTTPAAVFWKYWKYWKYWN
jgi:hypothetical protein